jgi:hypothetical protein
MIEEWISYKWNQTNTHISLCFLLTFLESRDEIPFKGGRVVTP